jgi:hypothetical protein
LFHLFLQGTDLVSVFRTHRPDLSGGIETESDSDSSVASVDRGLEGTLSEKMSSRSISSLTDWTMETLVFDIDRSLLKRGRLEKKTFFQLTKPYSRGDGTGPRLSLPWFPECPPSSAGRTWSGRRSTTARVSSVKHVNSAVYPSGPA